MIFEVLKKHWGFDSLRPLQHEIITAIVEGHDALVVLPTGGGKSLCYQLPAVCLPGLAIVISPLIALMKDQVDRLQRLGIPAAAIHSGLGARERAAAANSISAGRLKLLYLSPERLLTDKTLKFLHEQQLSFFAIDEAHCISSWGHDFRPEYGDLRRLRSEFPNIPLHAFTATATPRVREDIALELGLREPRQFVGDFRRPNLIYRAVRLHNGINQICSVMDRYRSRSGIIYCIARSDAEETSKSLNDLGYKTLPYHAGLTDDIRIAHQEAFLNGDIDTIVATIAFGMGIDKPDVRYVIHFGMPRSLENYQQESGRAGRDGRPAECWLLHSASDLQKWQALVVKSQSATANSALNHSAHNHSAHNALRQIHGYCNSVSCRHQFLTEHFGQQFSGPCAACDICLQELVPAKEPLSTAQKILSCVLRVREQFGTDHVAAVLNGSKAKKILQFSHQRLSTWGLLRTATRRQIRDWIEQLVSQGTLVKTDEYHQLRMTELGYSVLRGKHVPQLLQEATGANGPELAATCASIVSSWEGVDRGLFEALRQTRLHCANAAGRAAFLVFSDLTLRDMARRRPSTLHAFRSVHGVGESKSQAYGTSFLKCINDYCAMHKLETDIVADEHDALAGRRQIETPRSPNFQYAIELFRRRLTVAEIAGQLALAESTIEDYLAAFVTQERISDVAAWVPLANQQRIEIALSYTGLGIRCSEVRLRPVYEALHGKVPYAQIRVVVACLNNRRCTE